MFMSWPGLLLYSILFSHRWSRNRCMQWVWSQPQFSMYLFQPAGFILGTKNPEGASPARLAKKGKPTLVGKFLKQCGVCNSFCAAWKGYNAFSHQQFGAAAMWGTFFSFVSEIKFAQHMQKMLLNWQWNDTTFCALERLWHSSLPRLASGTFLLVPSWLWDKMVLRRHLSETAKIRGLAWFVDTSLRVLRQLFHAKYPLEQALASKYVSLYHFDRWRTYSLRLSVRAAPQQRGGFCQLHFWCKTCWNLLVGCKHFLNSNCCNIFEMRRAHCNIAFIKPWSWMTGGRGVGSLSRKLLYFVEWSPPWHIYI